VESNNLTAAAAFNRQRLQVLGMLKVDVNMTFEANLSDADLIDRLAGDDMALAAALRGRLVPASFSS